MGCNLNHTDVLQEPRVWATSSLSSNYFSTAQNIYQKKPTTAAWTEARTGGGPGSGRGDEDMTWDHWGHLAAETVSGGEEILQCWVQAAALAVVSEGIVTTVARASRRAACPLPWKHWRPCCLRPPHLWFVQLTWDTWGHMYPPHPPAVTHVLYMDLAEFAVSMTID
jgi:hypothetical protein